MPLCKYLLWNVGWTWRLPSINNSAWQRWWDVASESGVQKGCLPFCWLFLSLFHSREAAAMLWAAPRRGPQGEELMSWVNCQLGPDGYQPSQEWAWTRGPRQWISEIQQPWPALCLQTWERLWARRSRFLTQRETINACYLSNYILEWLILEK